MKQRYDLPPGLAKSQLLVRNDCTNVVYYVNKALASLLLHDQYRSLKHANCGLGVAAFHASKSGEYYMTHAGLQELLPMLSRPVLVRCSSADMRRALGGDRQDRRV